MKLYIPTSSLNFNNILSTDSISPKIFYETRGFGYPRWFQIPENGINNVTLLYEKPRVFTRPLGEMEDHPLLIEYTTDTEYPVCGEGVRYADKTIYLNPWCTRFVFFSSEDRETTMSLSESSLETKMIKLYNKKIVVDNADFEASPYPIVDDSKIEPFNSAGTIDNDRRINKFKGFLYGYYIGAYLSTSPDTLKKTNALREISNIFASVFSSVEKAPSFSQMERLTALFRSLSEYEPIYNEVLAVVETKEKTHNVFDILKNYGKFKYNPPFDWEYLLNELRHTSDEKDGFRNLWPIQELEKQNEIVEETRACLSVEKGEVNVEQGKLNYVADSVIYDPDLKNIYLSWVNDVLCTDEFNGKISSQKENLSDVLTKKAKEVLGEDRWQASSINTFMNQLRKHLRGEEFNQSWGNNVLSAIASCLIKGDEWDTLLLFMQSKGMTDYRLAFSFYGILNGFANLTRDFTDLLLNLDSKYVAEVYKEFARQLLRETIKKQVEESPLEKVSVESNIEKTPEQNTIFANSVKAAFNDSLFEYAGDKENLLKGLIIALDKNGNNSDPAKFLSILSKQSGWKERTKALKSMKNLLDPSIGKSNNFTTTTKSNDSVSPQGDLFSEENICNNDLPKEEVILFDNPIASGDNHTTSSLFIDDAGAKDFISTQDYLPKKLKTKLAKQVKNLQGRYEVGGKDANNPRDNENTINHFINWCFYDKGGFPPAVEKTQENMELLDRLKKDLLAYYDGR